MAIQRVTAPSARAACTGRARARRRAGARARWRARASSRSGCSEPPKADYHAWLAGGARPARCALAIAVDREHCVRELVCDLDARRRGVRSWPCRACARPSRPRTTRPPPRPCGPTPAGARPCGGAGWSDVSLVQIDVLASGGFGLDVERGRRVARAVAYLLQRPGDNGYAHPIESLIAYVDLDECRVLELEEMDVKPIPEADGAYAAGASPRATTSGPSHHAARGVSFTVEGNELRWHRWSLRAAIDPQEGLVLHDVRFDGRPVLHRASCAEMIVPYGESAPDALLAHVLRRRRIRPRRLHELARARLRLRRRDPLPRRAPRRSGGSSARVRNAICLHEEDAGLLWKHSDELAGRVEVRRARRFVVNSMVTVGNYDYAFRWYLHLDGSIECEVQLHGIVSTMALAPGEEPAGQHRHRPRARGAEPPALLLLPARPRRRRRRQQRARGGGRGRSRPAPENPLGNAFRARVTPLAQRVARRGATATSGAARVWHVVNPAAAQRARRRRRLPPRAAARRLDDARAARVRASRSAPASRAHTLWVDAPRRGRAAPVRPLSRTGSPRRSAYRSGARPTARSRTATSCSGTRSARRTSCVPRTGRSCRSRAPASGSSPSDSSTATRRWTSRRRMPATAGADGLDVGR